MRAFSNSQRRLKLAEAVGRCSAFESTAIRVKSRCSRGEHLARRGCSPSCSPHDRDR
jgi:hypothetical protein